MLIQRKEGKNEEGLYPKFSIGIVVWWLANFSSDRLNESDIHSRQSDHMEFNINRFRLLSPFAPNISMEEAEYDPTRSIGQKGCKLRTAGNSPVMSPSKLNSFI